MKTNGKKFIACAAISLLASVIPTGAGREIEKPETAVRLVRVRVFSERKDKAWFKFPGKMKPSFMNTGRR